MSLKLTNCAANRCLCLANSKLSDRAVTAIWFFRLLYSTIEEFSAAIPVLLTHPSVKGTPANDSLSVRFNKDPANLTTARSLASSSRGFLDLDSNIGSSSHLGKGNIKNKLNDNNQLRELLHNFYHYC